MPIMEEMNNHHHHHHHHQHHLHIIKRQTPGGNLDNIGNIGSPTSTVDSREKEE